MVGTGRRAAIAKAAAVLLVSAATAGSCGAGPGAGGIGGPWPTPGPGTPSGDDLAKAPRNLVQAHGGEVIPFMALYAVYIGDEGSDGVANRDAFLSWVLASNGYWTLLGQYVVGPGNLVQSARVPTASFFTSDVVASGSVNQDDLANAVAGYVSSVTADVNAYIFFMPTSVGITETAGGRQASCSVFGGYHSFLYGVEGNPSLPFAVIPPCPSFPRDMPTSHELVEMATDPFESAWYETQNGEEIGDLCNFPVSQPIDLWSPTRFWSNADGACVPP